MNSSFVPIGILLCMILAMIALSRWEEAETVRLREFRDCVLSQLDLPMESEGRQMIASRLAGRIRLCDTHLPRER